MDSQTDAQTESVRSKKELKCFSTFGQIFIVSLLCFMVILPWFSFLFAEYLLQFFGDKYVVAAIFYAYFSATRIVVMSLFLLYSISLFILSHCNYKIQELSLYLALTLYVLSAVVIFY
jgi:hypothetical protein